MQIQKTKLWEILTAPFSDFFILFIGFIFVLSALTLVDLTSRGLFRYAIYVFAYAVVLSYLFTFISSIIRNRKIYKIYIVLLLSYFLFILVIDYVCLSQFKCHISKDYIAAIMGTNMNETAEFFDTFISSKLLFEIALYIMTSLVLICLGQIMRIKSKFFKFICILSVFLSLGMTLRNSSVTDEIPLDKVSLFFQYDAPEDLHDYLANPSLLIEEGLQPSDIVIIIGESFAKSHSSLYGYERKTNPKLSAMEDSLILFQNVTSPSTGTIGAFKSIMSTYKPEYGDSIKWFTCTTLIEVLEKTGFYTTWYSNQSKNGFWDNEIGKYADLCDENYFVGNKYAGMSRTSYDEDVLTLSTPIINANHYANNVSIFHLMGSHPSFKLRYPEKYDRFKIEDYNEALPNQRQNLAEYDNSVLYNDSVVYELISLFKEKEAIVFYFSDHGLDIYNSSEDFCGHANANNPESYYWGTQIPFMVYMSDRYKEKFPEKVQVIEEKADEPFRTDDFIYMLMDIIGVKFASDTLPTRIRQNN